MADLDTAAKRHAGLALFKRYEPRPSGSDANTSTERGQLVGLYGVSVATVVAASGIGRNRITFRNDQRVTFRNDQRATFRSDS